MSDRDRGDDAYTGRAGQRAFIAQVLLRFANAAIPEVDVGCDVVVFSEEVDATARVQVKTGVVHQYKNGSGYWAKFSVPLKQLERNDDPPLFFALVARDPETATFPEYLIIPRRELLAHWEGEREFGSLDKKNNALVLNVQFYHRVILGVVCGEVELTSYRNHWELLPPLAAQAGQAATRAAGEL